MKELANVLELNNAIELNPAADQNNAKELNDAAAFVGFSFLTGLLFAHGLTVVRNSSQVVEDYQGNQVQVPDNQIAFRGARYVGNGWTILNENGDYIHPLAHFFFKGQSYWRLASFEAWPGATTAVALGKRIAPGNGTYWECSAAGITGGIEPADWADTASPVVDGGVTWVYKGMYQDEIGLLVEPLAENKCECYSFPPADEEQAALTSGQNVVGKVYEIKAQSALDFTTIGSADNVIGTQFVATGLLTLTAVDSIAEIKWAIGTQSTVANPTNIDGFTVSGDAAGLLTIRTSTAAEDTKFGQLTGWASKMYDPDNSAGAGSFTVIVDGDAGNTNNHSVSAYLANDGDVYIGIGGNSAAFSSGSMSRRVLEDQVVGGATNKQALALLAGVTASFLGPQLEESAYATSPIITEGAAATRQAVDADPPANAIRLNDIGCVVDWTPNIAGQVVDLFGTDTLKIKATATAIIAEATIGAASKTASIAITHAAGQRYRISLRKSSVSGLDVFVDGVKGTGDATATADVDTMSDYFVDGGVALNLNAFSLFATETDANMQEITDYD